MAEPRRSTRTLVTPGRLLYVLLVFVPLAALGHALHWSAAAVFVCAGLAIVPLAGMMGQATESIADRFGAGVGGLLNATFGNAAELIIALAALGRGLTGVVKASLTGSIIGNSLLVLGLSLFAGGLRRDRQTFDRTAASMGSTLLVLAVAGLVMPAVFHFVGARAVEHAALTAQREAALEGRLSLAISVVLFVAYLLSLVFSLGTHRHLYAGARHGGRAPGPMLAPALTLVAATALVAWMSELLVGSIDAASHALGLTPVFVGVVVVATVGNAAEHSTAVVMAIRDRMDLALAIAIGSSTQIALFVAPLLVFVARIFGLGPMDLHFTPFEVVSVAVAVGAAGLVSNDGESNWLEGALLVAVYLILALAFYYLP